MKPVFKSLLAALFILSIDNPAFAHSNLVTVPSLNGGFLIGLSGLYLVPNYENTVYGTLTNVNFSSTQNGIFSVPLDTSVGLIPQFVSGTTINQNTSNPSLRRVDPNYQWGFAVHTGYIFPCTGNDIVFNWNHFNTSNNSNTLASGTSPQSLYNVTVQEIIFPTTAITSGNLINTISGSFISPILGNVDNRGLSAELGNTAPFTSAFAHLNTKWDDVDVNFGQHLNIGGNFDLRMFGGLAWTRISEEINVCYQGAQTSNFLINVALPFIPGNAVRTVTNGEFSIANINEESTFKGFGPEVGFDGHYCFTNTNFGIAGHVGTQMLLGNVDTDINFTTLNSSASDAVTIVTTPQGNMIDEVHTRSSDAFSQYVQNNQSRRLVPELDANAGIDYTYHFSNANQSSFVTELGYQTREFFNALRNFRTSSRLESERVSFHGPFLTVRLLT
jgi:hypothetical protein